MDDKTRQVPEELLEERRKTALQKALEHEAQFTKPLEDDRIEKRMGSDLFKGGMR